MCCKFDSAINFITSASNAAIYEKMKFLIETDDDTFWRVDQLLRWLNVVDKSGYNHLPIVGNPDKTLNTSFLEETRRKNAVKDREKGEEERAYANVNCLLNSTLKLLPYFNLNLLPNSNLNFLPSSNLKFLLYASLNSYSISTPGPNPNPNMILQPCSNLINFYSDPNLINPDLP